MIKKAERIWQHVAAWPRLLLSTHFDAATLYDLLCSDALGSRGGMPVVNMGYWRDVDRQSQGALEAASLALFRFVYEAGEVSDADDRVVDVGCGFGHGAVQGLRLFQPRQIIGVNVSKKQIEFGRKLVADAQLQSRVEFVQGSATDLPLADDTIDKMVSVEAAFPFQTRADFFREAHRVLKPGGVLSMVDVLAPPG